MSEVDRFEIRIGGYAPRDSTHSQAIERFTSELDATELPIEKTVRWNVLDEGLQAGELLDLVERGELTLCYFSTSYLAARVPELSIIDLPYRFGSLEEAHRALDGDLGSLLSERTEAATGFRVLGYWENGFRHLTNSLRPIERPEDCRGMRVRLQPSSLHERMIELWGAIPVPSDLSEGIAAIKEGRVDAQENPLANTFAYGIESYHPFVTLSGHVYGARGVYVHAETFDAWPTDVQAAVRTAARVAIDEQRRAAATKEAQLEQELRSSGKMVIEPSAADKEAFVASTAPLHEQMRASLGAEVFST